MVPKASGVGALPASHRESDICSPWTSEGCQGLSTAELTHGKEHSSHLQESLPNNSSKGWSRSGPGPDNALALKAQELRYR